MSIRKSAQKSRQDRRNGELAKKKIEEEISSFPVASDADGPPPTRALSRVFKSTEKPSPSPAIIATNRGNGRTEYYNRNGMGRL